MAKLTKESVIDFPQETLDPSIWTQDKDGSYALRDDARQTIQAIVDWATGTFKIPDPEVHITGSITSNSYSKNSDVDIHFVSQRFKKEKADEFNKIFRKKFSELVGYKPELGSINGIKTEIYMQPNPFQDLMSVGCYDFTNQKWLVGPDFIDMSFDPYAEYFMKSMKSMDDIIGNVRSIILQMYELSVGVLKGHDEVFKEKIGKKFHATLAKAAKTFDILRKRRTHSSSPKNAEEALKNRDDKDWKIVDSAFKWMDKFGYLNVLKQAKDAVVSDEPIESAAQKIIDAITDKISSKSLDDSEKEFIGKLLEVEQQNESVPATVKMSFIAGLMAIASLLPATALEKTLIKAKQQNSHLTINSKETKKAIADAAKGQKMIGRMSETNLVNLVAQVLWKEARGEGTAGIKAVASVILNRTGNDPNYIVAVFKQPAAFECLAGYAGGWIDKEYKWYLPYKEISSNPSSKATWNLCNQIALQLVQQDFTSTIGNRNAYLNKKKASKKALDTWGKKCDLKVGNHHFGYLKENDPKYVVPGTYTSWKKMDKHQQNAKIKTVVVKSGDTLSRIAKDNNVTLAQLLQLNGNIGDPNNIKIGQKIRIA